VCFSQILHGFAHFVAETKTMIVSLCQAATTSRIVPQFDGTRTVNVFKCRNTKQMVCSCTCKVYSRMGLKCRHIYTATGTRPEPLDAIYCWWNDFDLAFLGEAIDVETRKKIVEDG
jgi:hypothetical protein